MSLRPRPTAALILVAGLVLSLAVNLPGHMSYDSVLQLDQGRSGVYNTWHPPVMAWLLGLGDALVRGTALFVLFDSLMLFGALIAVLWLEPEPRWAAAVGALVLIVLPHWVNYPGIVWKDVLFAASAGAGFVALAWTAALWRSPPWRWGLIAASVLLLALASLARQNGAVVLPFAAIAIGWIAWRSGVRATWSAVGGAAALVIGVGLVAGATLALNARSDGEPSRMEQLMDLQAYDLAAALRSNPALPLPRLRQDNPDLERLLRTKGAAAYSPIRIDPLDALEDVQDSLFETGPGAIGGEWRNLITRHPLLYLKVRATAFFWVLFTPDIRACVPVFTGVSGPEPYMSRLGLMDHDRPQDLALRSYGEALTWTPAFSHVLYLVIAVVCLAVLLRRRHGPDIALAAMLGAALAFTATYALLSIACDYRYLYMLDVSAMIASLYLLAGLDVSLIRTARLWRAKAR